MNGDHWLLYLTPPQEDNSTSISSITSPLTTLSSILPSLPTISPPDQTLEILMSRLAPSACKAFYHPSSPLSTSTESVTTDSHQLGSLLSKKLGLRKLLPNATEDAFLFSPCGFSSNSVQGDRYATIHVTPEEEFSYASFETNLTFGDGMNLNRVTGLDDEDNLVVGGPTSLPTLVEAVLDIFKPSKLSITLFVSSDAPSKSHLNKKGRQDTSGGHGMEELLNDELLDKYGLVDKIVYEFIGYRLVYAVYEEL